MTHLSHQFDPVTQWCLRCGAGAAQVFERDLGCTRAINVIAISHRVRGAVLRRICEQVQK